MWSCGSVGCCQPRCALLRRSGATAAAKGERRALVGLEEALGWWSAAGRERGTEHGVGAPMATGWHGFELVEGGLSVRDVPTPFYSRRAPDRGNGGTDGPQRVTG
jgi:hypothetical protein